MQKQKLIHMALCLSKKKKKKNYEKIIYIYTQKLRYYPSTVNLHGCVRNCNTLNKLSNRVCVPNKTEDFNPSIFNIVTRINEFKTLAKHISC